MRLTVINQFFKVYGSALNVIYVLWEKRTSKSDTEN